MYHHALSLFSPEIFRILVTIMASTKGQAVKLLDSLPDTVTWDEIMYAFYLREKVADGSEDLQEGRTLPSNNIKKKFLRP